MGNSDRLIYRSLLIAIVLAPLPFASNRPWAWSLLALVVGAMGCKWAWQLIRYKMQPTVPAARVILPLSLYLAVCAYAVLQVVPMDVPGVANQYWILAQQEGVKGIRPTISISSTATWTALMRLITYGMVFWLMLQTTRSAPRAQQAVLALGLSAATYALYGLVATLSGSAWVLWFDKWSYEDSLTGTFINRNSFATFLGLGLLCIVAHLSHRLSPLARGTDPSESGFLSKGVPVDLILTTGAAMCLVAALVLTQSRAGVLSSLLGVAVFLVGIGTRVRKYRATAVIVTGSIASIFTLFFFVSGEGLEHRLSRLIWSDADLLVRTKIYASTLSAIADHPLLGLGYGTFEDGFKIYRSEETRAYFDKAHNTYLELAMELGVPAATALVLAVASIAILCLRGFLRRQRMIIYPLLGFCATILVGFHALVDFSLQMPAVAIQYAAILAIGCAQSWRSRTDAKQFDR